MSDIDWTIDDCIDGLKNIESDLHSRDFRKWLQTQSLEDRDNMVAMRQELRRLRTKLENAQLQNIAAKLDRLGPDLRNGIQEMDAVLEELNQFKKALTNLSLVLGIVGRIVA